MATEYVPVPQLPCGKSGIGMLGGPEKIDGHWIKCFFESPGVILVKKYSRPSVPLMATPSWSPTRLLGRTPRSLKFILYFICNACLLQILILWFQSINEKPVHILLPMKPALWPNIDIWQLTCHVFFSQLSYTCSENVGNRPRMPCLRGEITKFPGGGPPDPPDTYD